MAEAIRVHNPEDTIFLSLRYPFMENSGTSGKFVLSKSGPPRPLFTFSFSFLLLFLLPCHGNNFRALPYDRRMLKRDNKRI